jgi:hypothetical protein
METERANRTIDALQQGAGYRARNAKFTAAVSLLSGKPTASAEFLYQDEDPEAFALALTLREVLKGAGWRATDPAPLQARGQYPSTGGMPAFLSLGG